MIEVRIQVPNGTWTEWREISRWANSISPRPEGLRQIREIMLNNLRYYECDPLDVELRGSPSATHESQESE